MKAMAERQLERADPAPLPVLSEKCMEPKEQCMCARHGNYSPRGPCSKVAAGASGSGLVA